MKHIISAMLVTVALLNSCEGATQTQRLASEYSAGVRIGQCIVVGCVIFRGFIVTEFPKSGEPLIVKVEELLFGAVNSAGPVPVPYEILFDRESKYAGYEVGAAWAHVQPQLNRSVIVVMGTERGFGVFPGMPVVVSSDEREMAITRNITRQASSLIASPNLLRSVASSAIDPPMAGFLFEYIAFSPAVKSRDERAELLCQLLPNPNVPPDRRDELSNLVVTYYQNSTGEGRTLVIAGLSRLLENSDGSIAAAAFRGIAKIVKEDHRTLLQSPPGLTALMDASYRRLLKEGKISRDVSFEMRIGSSPE
jgi:hypothetical protein